MKTTVYINSRLFVLGPARWMLAFAFAAIVEDTEQCTQESFGSIILNPYTPYIMYYI